MKYYYNLCKWLNHIFLKLLSIKSITKIYARLINNAVF